MGAFGLLPSMVEMIRVNDLENRLHPKIPFPHKHSFFQLVFIKQGQGWHEIDFKRHEVKSGQLFNVKPGQVHAWELSTDTKGFLVEFEFSAIRRVEASDDHMSQLFTVPDVLEFSGATFENLLRLCEDMITEQSERQREWENLLLLRLLTFIFLIFRFSPPHSFSLEKSGIIHNFFELVNTHYSRHHNIEFYAEKLGLTPKALTMRVSRACGIPPKRIIHDRCLLEAKRLLAYSSLPNSAIAEKVGFDDPNYFTRLFRSKIGMTPSEFRLSQQP
jgi:AraC family transcriptional activator of pobA